MRKAIFAILVTLFVLTTLVACQKTPEDSIVVGKNNAIMIEKAQGDAETPGASGNLYKSLEVPNTYQNNLTSKGGRLNVLVDAPITLPTSALPIVRVAPASFTSENVRTYADALFGENASYIDMSTDNYTKGYYQREINRLRNAINEWDTTGNQEYDLVYGSKNEAEQGLSMLINKAASAPDSLPRYTPSFEWKVANSGDQQKNGNNASTNKSMYIFAMPDEATVSRLLVQDRRMGVNQVNLTYERDITNGIGMIVSSDSMDVSNLIAISEEAALQLAQDTISKCGINGFTCTGTQQLIYNTNSSTRKMPLYRFMFTRQVNGVNETYTNADYSRTDGEGKPWQYEKINVLVSDQGIEFFQYRGPVEVRDIVLTNAKLLPFSDIRAIFEKMIVIVNNTADTESQDSTVRLEYHISDIVLGLMCVREQNSDAGLLIPVWDFRGYGRVVGDIEGSYLIESNGYKSFLTINAVDGSIVDRTSGY